jgi:hypothetical protein
MRKTTSVSAQQVFFTLSREMRLWRVTSPAVFFSSQEISSRSFYAFLFLSLSSSCLFAGWRNVKYRTCIEVDDPCTDTPCSHGGTCVSNGGKFTCYCAPGWSGLMCETCADSSILFVDPRNPIAYLTTKERDFQPLRVHLTLSNFIGDNATRVLWAGDSYTIDNMDSPNSISLLSKYVDAVGQYDVVLQSACRSVTFKMTYLSAPVLKPAVKGLRPAFGYREMANTVEISTIDMPRLFFSQKLPELRVSFRGVPGTVLSANSSTGIVVAVSPILTGDGTLGSLVGELEYEGKGYEFTFRFLTTEKDPSVTIVSPTCQCGAVGGELFVLVQDIAAYRTADDVHFYIRGNDVRMLYEFEKLSSGVRVKGEGAYGRDSMTFRLGVPYIEDVDKGSRRALFLLLEVGGVRYGSIGFVYEAPRRPQVSFVSRQSGTVLGGDTVLVKFVDVEFQSTEATPVIKVSFGDKEAEVPRFVLTGTAAGEAEFLSPRSVQDGVVNVVMEIAGLKTLGTYTVFFDYEYKLDGAPEIQSYVPDSSWHGEPTSVSVKCTNVVMEHTGDLSVSFTGADDGAKVAVVSPVKVYDMPGVRFAMVVTFGTPGDLSEGTYVVSISWDGGSKRIAFDFTVLPPLRASIISLKPSTSLSSGGEMVVQVAELRPVERANQIRVEFGNATPKHFGAVKSLLVSTTSFTSFSVIIPQSTWIGDVNITVFTTTFKKTDLPAVATVRFIDATASVVTSVQPKSGFESGGALVTIHLDRFPRSRVMSSAAELAIEFGDDQAYDCAVLTSSFDPAADFYRTTISFRVPRVSSTMATGRYTVAKVYDRLDFSGASAPEFEFEFWPLPVADPFVKYCLPSVSVVGQVVVLELGLTNVGNLLPHDIVVTIGELQADITSTIVYQHYSVVIAKVGPFTKVGLVGGEVYRAALGRIDAIPFQFEVSSPYSIAQYYPNVDLVVGGAVLTVVLNEQFPSVGKRLVVADFNGQLANGTLSSKAGDLQTVNFVVPMYSDLMTTKDIFLPNVPVYVVEGSNSIATSLEFTYLALPSTPPQILLVSPVRVAINEAQTILITIDGIVVSDPASDISVSVDGIGVAFKYIQLDILVASILVMSPFQNQEEKTMLVRVAWATEKYVETGIEVFKRKPEVDFFYPSSGFHNAVITVGILYLRDRSMTPTCAITTSRGRSSAAGVLSTTPHLQLEIPNSLDLDKSELVTISVKYGNGDAVDFEWEFIPDTSPSILLVSPPSQFTYGGLSTSLAVTNSNFTLVNLPLIHVGESLAPPVRIEKQNDFTVVHFIAPAVTCKLGVQSCYIAANVTHSSYEVPLFWKMQYIVPSQPTVQSLTQYTGSSFGGDYLAATILDLPPVADDDVSVVTIKVGTTFVQALAVYNNKADGSLHISFVTPPLPTGASMLTTVQFARAGIPQLAARVEFTYYDVTEVRLIDVPPIRVGSNQGGAEESVLLSFSNFAVLSEIEMALNPAAIFGFQCVEEFSRVVAVIKNTKELLRVRLIVPSRSQPGGVTTCYFFRKDEPEKRAAVEFAFEDTSRPTVTSVKPAEALVSGGDVLRLNVAHFPTNSVDIADVLVLVGGVEADILRMETTVAALSSTVFFITVPPEGGKSLGGSALSQVVRCSISLRAASAVRADFEFIYVAAKFPEITYTSKTRISAFGGESVSIHLQHLIEVPVSGEGSYSSNEVTVLFGVVKGRVSVVSWTAASTVLHVLVPALASTGDVDVRVFANQEGSEHAAVTRLFAFRDEPLLNLNFPERGGASGSSMTAVLSNILEYYALADVTATVVLFDGTTANCSVRAAYEGDGATWSIHLFLAAPPTTMDVRRMQSAEADIASSVPADLRSATVSLAISNFAPISFPWNFIDDSQPYIFSVYPPDGPQTGYRIVTLDVRNWPGLANVFAEDEEGISVTFGGREAFKVRKVTEEEAVGNAAEIKTLISIMVPSFPAFGAVDMTLSLNAGGAEDTPILHAEFMFYSTCNFESFCRDQHGGFVVNTGVLESFPPADAVCSFIYCIKPPPPPFLQDLSTYTVFDVGGDRVVATLAEWPQSELSLVSIKVVVDESTFIVAASSLEVRGETTDTAITFTTPVMKAGSGSLVFVDIESGVSLVVQKLQVVAYPQGKLVLLTVTPTFGISDEATSVLVELSNCPPSDEADVDIRFGNIRMHPLLSFTSTRKQTSVVIAVPSRICTEDCSTLVEISVPDRFGMPRTAHFVFTHRVPEPTITSHYPIEGVSTQLVRVTVVVESMKVIENGQARYVNSESDVFISWAGKKLVPIDGSGVVSGRSFSFAFLTPAVQSVSQAEDVLVSVISMDGTISTTAGGGRGSQNNGTFIYTYLPATAGLISVMPSRIPTTHSFSTPVKFTGQFFSAKGVSVTICGVRVTPDCDYSAPVKFLVCVFAMPKCNKLGHDMMLVHADDLEGRTLEKAVEFVVPPVQVLISLESTAVPTISHTTYKKVASTSPTPIILYAWSAESDFPQVC